MEIKDLLDRFEIMFSDNERLSHLRRAYTDKDVSSVFKLIKIEDEAFFEDFRKAVLDKNMHSIFRLIKSEDPEYLEDFRKATTEKNIHSLFRVIGNKLVVGHIDDLRKAVIEQNWHSIFRLCEIEDDIRKAILENNLHSLFRIFYNNDEKRKAIIEENLASIFDISKNDELKSLILGDDKWSLWKVLKKEVDTYFITVLKQLEVSNIEIDYDCLSRGQLKSKIWLVSELKSLDLNLGTVFICAGWYATLATLLFERNFNVKKIRSFDIDESCISIAETFNRPWVTDGWKFKSVCQNILNIDYKKHTYIVNRTDGSTCELTDAPDTIINTSCEHIENFSEWYSKIPTGKLVIVQSNDYFAIQDHVNCSSSLEDFAKSTPLNVCLYQGELDLGQYRRFMRIGYR